MQNTPKEGTGRQGKSTVAEGFEDDYLVSICGAKQLTVGGASPDEVLLRQDEILDHPLEFLLRHSGFDPHFLRVGD